MAVAPLQSDLHQIGIERCERALERTARVTTCPYKGEANYYSLSDGKARDENAVWTYEHPKTEVAEIAGCLAFYPDKVEIKIGG